MKKIDNTWYSQYGGKGEMVGPVFGMIMETFKMCKLFTSNSASRKYPEAILDSCVKVWGK